MSTLKHIALSTLGIVTFGFLFFGFATIALTIVGIAGALLVTGFLAKPLLPKASRKPDIIEGEVISSHQM